MKKIQKHLTKHLRGVLAVALTAAVVVSVAAVTSSQNLHAEFPVYAAEGDESTQSVSEPTEPQNTEPQSTDTQNTDTQNTGTQTAEPQTTQTQNTEPQNTEPQNTEPAAAPATDPQPSTLDSEPLTASATPPAAAQSATTKYDDKSEIPKYNSETGKIDVSYKYATVESNGTLNENNVATFPQDYKDAYLDGYSFDLPLPPDGYTVNKIVENNGKVFLGWKDSTKQADTDPFVTKVTVTDKSDLVTLIPIFSTYSITTLRGYTHGNKTLTFSWNYISETGKPSDDTLQTVLSDSTLITFLQNGYSTVVSKFPTVFDQYKSTPYPDTGYLNAYQGKYFVGWSLKSNPTGIDDVVTTMTITDKNNGDNTLYPVFTESQYSKVEYTVNFLDKSGETQETRTGSITYDKANDKYTFSVSDVKAPAESSTIPASSKWFVNKDGTGYSCTAGQSIKDYLLGLYKKSPSRTYMTVTFYAEGTESDTTGEVTIDELDTKSILAFVRKISKYDSSFRKYTKGVSFYEITPPSAKIIRITTTGSITGRVTAAWKSLRRFTPPI